RLDGLSKKQFSSLNCSSSNEDNKKNVNGNRLIAIKNLNLNKKKLILIKQTHSSKVIRINEANLDKKIEADGIITSLNNVVLGILTADCAPIIIYDDKNKFVCNLHSGWKGSLNNISKNAIKLFDEYNIKRKNLIAIVGPCLGAKNYEVDKNFQQKFIKKNLKYAKFFRNKNAIKSYFNLRALINYQLSELGLKKIHNINRDTYSNDNLFFSHRRATHKGQKTTGRLINLISLT
ncbi:MAG: peptidoglycan editing factor PgeF, partial [Proteobacteria bacterium]|nr:peptidoglycan editing factor PgeF [Pseudomonadota bacterium]